MGMGNDIVSFGTPAVAVMSAFLALGGCAVACNLGVAPDIPTVGRIVSGVVMTSMGVAGLGGLAHIASLPERPYIWEDKPKHGFLDKLKNMREHFLHSDTSENNNKPKM